MTDTDIFGPDRTYLIDSLINAIALLKIGKAVACDAVDDAAIGLGSEKIYALTHGQNIGAALSILQPSSGGEQLFDPFQFPAELEAELLPFVGVRQPGDQMRE